MGTSQGNRHQDRHASPGEAPTVAAHGLSSISVRIARESDAKPTTQAPHAQTSEKPATRAGLSARLASLNSIRPQDAAAACDAEQCAPTAGAHVLPQEHANVAKARAVIAQMAARQAAGESLDDGTCVACSLLDAQDGAESCSPAAPGAVRSDADAARTGAAKSHGATAVRKTTASAVKGAREKERAAKRRQRNAFGIGLAGGAAAAFAGGIAWTVAVYDSKIVTAAPHHAVPVSFQFAMAKPESDDAGPAWAWREAVTMRTMRDLAAQHVGPKLAFAEIGKKPAMEPVRSARLGEPQPSQPPVSAGAVQERTAAPMPATSAATDPQPSSARTLVPVPANTVAEPQSADGAKSSSAETPAAPSVQPRPATVVLSATADPALTPQRVYGSLEPDRDAKPPRRSAHHVMTKPRAAHQATRAAPVRKPSTALDDSSDSDTAMVPTPRPRLIASSHASAPAGKPMGLGASDVGERDGGGRGPLAKAEKWYRKALPDWAPFKGGPSGS